MKSSIFYPIKFLFILIVLVSFTKTTTANHIAGSEISYEHINQDSFLVKLKVYRYCSGGSFSTSSVIITATSRCGGISYIVLNKISGSLSNGATEITQKCSSASAISNCTTGSMTGYEEYLFEGIAVLSARCNCWTIGYAPPCCRNSSANFNGGNLYVETKICNQTKRGNSSPIANSNPIPSVCAGVLSTYNLMLADPDGDSLSYHFVCAKENDSTCGVYSTPHTAQSPIAGISLDAKTGQIEFTPTITGSFVVAIKVVEWSRTGRKIGSKVYDLQFRSETCTNSPAIDTLGIQNFAGLGSFNSATNTIEVCEGDSFSFDVLVWDPVNYSGDSTDTLILTSNISARLPGATYVVNPINDSVQSVRFAWKALELKHGEESFQLKTSDNACPKPNFTYSSYTVKIKAASHIEVSTSKICTGDTIAFTAKQTQNTRWTALPGGSGLILGTNFSCDTCASAQAWPSLTTTYVLIGDSNVGCSATDTLSVFVSDTFSIQTVLDTVLCSGDTIFNYPLTLNPPSSYTYKWEGTHYISDRTQANPDVSGSGNADLGLQIIRQGACEKILDIGINFVGHPKDLAGIRSESDSVCAGIPFELSIGPKCMASCGELNKSCGIERLITNYPTADGIVTQSGTGALPNPFYSSIKYSSTRMVYDDNSLTSQGFVQGNIRSLRFRAINSQDIFRYATIEVRAACVDSTGPNWTTPTQLVYSRTNVSFNGDEFTLNLDSSIYKAFGKHLLIEFCVESAANLTNPQLEFTNTVGTSSITRLNAFSPACGLSGGGFTNSSRRPLMAIEFDKEIDSLNYQVSWSPSSVFMNNTSFNTQATIGQNDTLTAIVSDTFGACIDTLHKAFFIRNVGTIQLQARADSLCLDDTMSLSSSMAGGQFSGPGMLGNVFNSSIAGTGLHTLNYVINHANACIDSASISVYVRPPANINFQIPDLCDNGSNFNLNATPSGGTFTGLGVITSELKPSSLNSGTYQANYDYTDPFGCEQRSTVNYDVLPSPSATFDTLGGLCENDSALMLFGGFPMGGAYSGPGIVGSDFDPNITGPGVFDLTYIYSDTNACSDTASTPIVVYAKPAAISILGAQLVTGTSSHTYSISKPTSTSLTWSVIGGSIVVDYGDSIEVSWDSSGLGVITIIETDSNSCSNLSSLEVNITALGLNEISNTQIRVTPNPSSGAVRISSNTNGLIKFRLRNILGQEVIAPMLLNSGSSELNIPGASGVYLLEAKLENGEVEVFRIVKE